MDHRRGTPWIESNGVVVYEVHNPKRKSLGLSFLSKDFDGWAKDGRELAGYAVFPREAMPVPFSGALTSGRELILSRHIEMVTAYRASKKGDMIRFHFADGEPRKGGPDSEEAAWSEEGSPYIAVHRVYERDSALARKVRADACGRCAICEANYADRYGELGMSVIEAHHLWLLSDGRRVSAEGDFVAICANCHRLVHAWMRDQQLTYASLKKLRNAVGELGGLGRPASVAQHPSARNRRK